MEKSDYCMPYNLISPGQVCAALYDNNWYRAEILTPAANMKCKV